MAKMKRHYEELRSANNWDQADEHYFFLVEEAVNALVGEVQSIYDVIGELQKGKLPLDKLPQCYAEIVAHHMKDLEGDAGKSDCCGADVILSDICSDCKEHQ